MLASSDHVTSIRVVKAIMPLLTNLRGLGLMLLFAEEKTSNS
jgi:hypothetical protein